MQKHEVVWVLTFDGDNGDLNGVFSSRERARETLMEHYERCKEVWKDFRLEDTDDFGEIWGYDVGADTRWGATIEQHCIDANY